MPTIKVPFGNGNALVTIQRDWKAGDLPPDNNDYLAWHEWADVQYKAGIRQKACGKCGGWKTPQELSGESMETTFFKKKNMTSPITVTSPICSKCVADMQKDDQGNAT